MNTLVNTATSRSQLFQLFALGFSHPVAAFHHVLLDKSYAQALSSAASEAQCPGQFTHTQSSEFTEFEADYIHLFQMGRGGKPLVGLNAGDHKDVAKEQGRPEFLLEYSAWYRHFGLKTIEDEGANELPDHLDCQLEFMSWLAHLENTACDDSELLQGYQRAQRDFLERHLQPHLEVMVTELKRLADQARGNPFYLTLSARALEATDVLLEQLDSALIDASQTDSPGNPEQIAAVNLWG